MPLYKRRSFPIVDPPKDLDPKELVYQVRFTKEIFRDYQEYLNRLNLYRQRLWTCKVTGKTNLTYEEALVSEHRATERVQQFPDELIPLVLNMIQYSTLNLTDLINEIRTKLNENIYQGIELHAKKGESVCACKVIEILDDNGTTRYKVGWIDRERKVTDTSVVCAEDLIRKKPTFSRSILKAFIRESTSQTSPWVVHEKLARKHGISTELPRELIDKLASQNGFSDVSGVTKKGGRKFKLDNQNAGPFQKKRKGTQIKEQIKYPIDDLFVKPSADDPVFTDRPPLSTDFRVPIQFVGDLLMVWNFCISFGKMLHLWPFSFEDFENAVCYKDSELMLILESHSAILNLLIKDGGDYFMAIQNKKQKFKVKLTNWAEYLCHFLDMKDKPELSDHIPIIRRGHYGLLDIRVKLGILRELVDEALMTSAVRGRLDECIEQQQVLMARKREKAKEKKEDLLRKGESHAKEMDQEHIANGVNNCINSNIVSMSKDHNGGLEANGKVPSAYNKNIMENGYGIVYVRRKIKGKKMPQGKENRDDEKQEKKSDEEQREENLQKEIEKFSIRTNYLGKDRNYNRYWFFRREGRLFVESLDSSKWGYYSTKEELDALIGSLNVKGVRERDLKRHFEKYYMKISTALQKRSKDVAQKALVEEGELRRSTRVRDKPRFNPAMAFLRYVNRWREKTNSFKRQKCGQSLY